MTLFHPSGRPAGRFRWPARWVAGLAAVLLAVAMLGLSAAAGAQQSPGTTVASSEPTDTTADPTDTTADPTDTTADPTETTVPDDTGEDATTTTAAEEGDDGAADDPNGNVNNLPEHDGSQKGDVFNATPFGEIPGKTPQVLVLRPGSGRILPLNREIQIRARFDNFEPGFFSEPQTQYGVKPQRLNADRELQGHNHGCIQRIAANGAVPAETCDSFVVLEREGDTDILSGIAPPLTQTGRYRVCVDAASETHYVAARAFAQRGGPVDCVRVLVMDRRSLR